MKKNSIVFIITLVTALVVCTVVRYLQCVAAIDYSTGFFYNTAGILHNLLYIVFAAFFLIITVATFVARKKKCYFFKKRVGKIDSTETMILATLFVVTGIGYSVDIALTIDTEKSATLQYMLAAFGFLIIGLGMFMRKRISLRAGFFCVIPAGFHFMMAFRALLGNLILTNMSDELIRLVIDLTLTWFYLALGRVFSRNETPFSKSKVNVLGLFATLMIFSESIAKLIYWLTLTDKIKEQISMGELNVIMPSFSFVAEGATILVVLLMMHKLPFTDALKFEKHEELA